MCGRLPSSSFVLESVAIGESTSRYGVRSEWPEIDRSRDVVVVKEEVRVVLLLRDIHSPVDLLVSVVLKSRSLSAARGYVVEESLDGEVRRRCAGLFASESSPVVILAAPSRIEDRVRCVCTLCCEAESVCCLCVDALCPDVV